MIIVPLLKLYLQFFFINRGVRVITFQIDFLTKLS
jgi:hypothetical protein